MKDKRRDLLSRKSQSPESNGTMLPFVSGMGLGAGIMYAFDPDRGNRRRAMAQQKLARVTRLAGDALDKGVRDLEHRARGLFIEAMCLVRRQQVPDDVLAQRVRSKLGRVACHPGSIEVSASGATVVLTGPVLRGEADNIARAVRRVRGVRGVDARLEEHDSSENIPGLQGRSERAGDRPELLQANWAPGTRLVMGGVGLALLARAIRRPGLLNGMTGVLGLGLLARSGRNTRVVGSLMDTMKPTAVPRAGRRERAQGGGSGEVLRDVVGRSGVYPATGPFPPGPAEVRVAGQMGGGSYEDHGSSEMTYTGNTVLGALSGREARTAADRLTLLQEGEIPRESWVSFFNQLDKAVSGERVTIELREGGQTRVAQRDMPLDGFGADVKARELMVNIGVGQSKDDLVIHNLSARRVLVHEDGNSRVLEIEGNDGRSVLVRFRGEDLRPRRVVA